MTHDLTKYEQFNSTCDLNKTVTLHKKAHDEAMNKTDLAILDILHQYSIKHGAAHITHRRLEQMINKSNPTVRRSLRKLCKLRIIERIHYIRPVMKGLGANIYVFKPYTGEMKTSEN